MNPDPLAALKADFRLRAMRDADALQAALGQERVGDGAVERLVHGLAGSADIFGHADIGQAARAIDACFADGRQPDLESVRALSRTIRESLGRHS